MVAAPIEVRLSDVPIDDPLTLQLRMAVESRDARNPSTNTVSTVWLKDGQSLSFDATLHEQADEPRLAGAAERASLEAISVEHRFDQLSVAPVGSFDHAAPDVPVVYVDTGDDRHEI